MGSPLWRHSNRRAAIQQRVSELLFKILMLLLLALSRNIWYHKIKLYKKIMFHLDILWSFLLKGGIYWVQNRDLPLPEN